MSRNISLLSGKKDDKNSLFEGIDLDESMSITGTINSGGLIGYVGGIKAKVEAAADIGLSTVLIPQGERFVDDDENGSVFSSP